MAPCCPHCGRPGADAAIWIGDRRGMRLARVHDIVALLADNSYTSIWTREGMQGYTKTTMCGLMTAHPQEWFRVHRNAAIRLSAVRRVWFEPPDMLVSVPGVDGPIHVSRRRRAAFREEAGAWL